LVHWTGALCFADDLTLLAPYADAMRGLLGVCNEYATEHTIKFNPLKSKYIAFTLHHNAPGRVYPTFYINNVPTKRVDGWPHLGNILQEDQDEAGNINYRRRKMATSTMFNVLLES
jgi:hypothetical protein